MRSAIRVIGLAGLLAMLAGCRMCASPYDYCGPTYGVENCDDGCGACGVGCSVTDRRGSILSAGGCSGCGYDGGYGSGYGETWQDGQGMPSQGEVIYEGTQPPAETVPANPTTDDVPNEAMRPTPDPRMSRRPMGPGPGMGGAASRFVR